MNFSPTQIIQAELSRNESALWTGQSQQGIIFRGSDFFLQSHLAYCGVDLPSIGNT